MKARVATVLASSLALAVLGGCGGPSHASFVAKLNKLCTDVNSQLSGLGATESVDKAAGAMSQAAKVESAALKKLNDLKAPDKDKDAFMRYHKTITVDIGLLKRYAYALRTGDEESVASLKAEGDRQKNARRLAAIDLGADSCSRT